MECTYADCIAALLNYILNAIADPELALASKNSCNNFKNPPKNTPKAVNVPSVIIKNATVWTGTGTTLQGYDLIVGTDGKIQAIDKNLATPQGASEIQASGAWLTPGLFDLHSHAGVYSFPGDTQATQDGTSSTKTRNMHSFISEKIHSLFFLNLITFHYFFLKFHYFFLIFSKKFISSSLFLFFSLPSQLETDLSVILNLQI